MSHLSKQLTNFDSFNVAANSLMGGGMTNLQVSYNYRSGGICFQHREYVGDVLAAQNFTTYDFDINPGLANNFPWVSQIANCFEQYEWKGLVYEYRSMSSDAVLSSASSSALGTVCLSTQYNALDTPFNNKREMNNNYYSNSAKPSVSFIHPVDCRRKETPYKLFNVRNSGAFLGDKRLYDIGSFQIAVQGCQGTTGVIGELWVNYELCFYKPKFQPGANILTDLFVIPGDAYGYSPSPAAATQSSNLGNANGAVTVFRSPPQLNGNLNGTIDTAQDQYLFDPDISDGYFLVNYAINAGFALQTEPDFTSLVNVANAYTVQFQYQGYGGTPLGCCWRILKVTGPNASFKITGANWTGGAASSAELVVTQIFSNIDGTAV